MKNAPIPVRLRPLLRAMGALADQLGVKAYAVGGCVRDWLLRRRGADSDLDVAVEGDGLAFAQAAARALDAAVTVHEQFGTATLAVPGHPERRIDVATCRKETYAKPAAYPRVTPGTLRDDLARRDFTINAMAVALNGARFGRLIDPFGGARDLGRRRLRVLHPRSFEDDPSRILRGVRFLARFGFDWDPDTERAARAAMAAGAIGWLNTGRLRKELDRISAEGKARVCLEQFALLSVRAAPGRRRR